MKNLLTQLGLEEKEIIIYLECLTHQQNTPASIVKHTRIKRSTVYFYLDRLNEKGLIIYKVKGKKRYAIPVTPQDAMLEYAEKKKEQAQNIEQAAGKLISKLQDHAKQKKTTSNDIVSYHGETGVRLLMQDIIKQNKDIYWFGSSQTLLSFISEEAFYKNMTLKRMLTKTTSHGITDKEILKKRKFSELIGDFRKFKFIDFPASLNAILVLYNNKIAIGTKEKKEIQIILIENNIMAEMFLFMFKQLWINI